jgi:hypothetical protein
MAVRLVSTIVSILWLAAAAGCSGDDAADTSADESDAAAGDRAGVGGDSGSGARGSRAGRGGEEGGGAGSGSGAGRGGDGSMPDGGGDPFVPVPIAELPDAFAEAICDALVSCVGAAALRELTAREDCAARVTAELKATEFFFMDDAIAAGSVLYDSEQLPACVAGVRELGCAVLSDSFPQPCVEVLAGNVALDGECTISAECQGTAFCAGAASGTCPSTCMELLAAGAQCSADNECGDRLMCTVGKCEAPSAVGEPCGGDSGQLCALGLNCMGSTDTEIGECTENAAIQVGQAGDACAPGGTLCVEGLSCVFDGVDAFHCEPYVDAGAACHLGLPGQCPVDQYCDAQSVDEQGTCQPLPVDDQACVLGDVCAPGFACVVESGSPVCRPIRDNGGDCGADQACRSGHCVDGRCEPPPTCAE